MVTKYIMLLMFESGMKSQPASKMDLHLTYMCIYKVNIHGKTLVAHSKLRSVNLPTYMSIYH